MKLKKERSLGFDCGRRKEEEEKKEEEKRKEEEEGKTVMVGIKMDSKSRELLTWALVKVALPGDRVVALHVLPATADISDLDGKSSPSSLLSLVKAFDSVLAVYEGFCNLKQIDLKLKLCRDSSIHKALVREANSYAATRLILGVSKNNRTMGFSSAWIAKYCAKKLSQECSVIAVNNGKIAFHREARPTSRSEGKGSVGTHNNAQLALVAHQASSKTYSKFLNARAQKLAMIKAQTGSNADASRSSCHWLSVVPKSLFSHGSAGLDNNSLQLGDMKRSCTVVEKETPCAELRKDESLAIVPVNKSEAPSSCASGLIRDSPEVRPGWPLLRKAVLSKWKNTSEDSSDISVVQWAMRLPSRYLVASAVHPDRTPIKPESNVISDCSGESGAIVPMETDSSSKWPVILEEEKKIPKELVSLQEKYSSVCRLFSYKELMDMTSNFSPDKLVGKGGNSRVYKGHLSDGRELAVKILKPSEDVLNEFALEIEIITSLHHKNIISLFGFCFENENLILVYDFLPRGSLEENLHGEGENKIALDWAERYKVAVGVAEALDYLHGAGNPQPVIHRDVKSSNILLSDDFEPQLSDFGLAMWATASTSHSICSDVAGTFGYLAPEYFMYGKVNEKIDVYAFGVVLLELLSGKKPVCTGCPKGEESLVMWAKPILQGGKAKQLVDPCLGTNYDDNELERMILAASLCIRRAPRSRPQITLVLKLLRGDDDVLKWARSQASASEELDGMDDEAAYENPNIQSHINLALLDVDDDSLSVSSTEPSVDFITANTSLEEYLRGRWSRSSSFD